MKQHIVALSVMLVFANFALAKTINLDTDRVCLPFGSKVLDAVSDVTFDNSVELTSDLSFGVVLMKKGCEVGLQVPFEVGSEHSVEELRAVRTIRYISCRKTGFILAGKKFISGHFDLDGCLKSPVFLFEPAKVCGNLWPTDQEIPFKKGRIQCPGR